MHILFLGYDLAVILYKGEKMDKQQAHVLPTPHKSPTSATF